MASSHCGDEAHSHDHNGHSHSHSPPPDLIPGDSLYSKIQLERVQCLNERTDGMARSIIKPWDQRLDTEKFLESDADEQMVVFIPFTGQVKLKSVLLRAPPDNSAPKTIKMFYNPNDVELTPSFHNREDIDFSIASDLPATETITTIPPQESTHQTDVIEYPIKRVNFNNVRNITLYIEDNWDASEEEVSRLWYIGFKGEWTELRDAPLVTVYEARANPADHKKVTSMSGARQGLGH